MKLVDLNVLLYAVNRDSPRHDAIRSWWEAALSGDEPVGLTWTVIIGFLRLATSPQVFAKPLTLDQAIDRVDTWLSHPNTRLLSETEEHWRILKELIDESGTAGNLTADAHLAALVRKKVPLAQFRKAAHEVIRRHPSDFMPHLVQARYAAGFGKTEALASLNKAMFLHPRSPQIHLETARILRRFGKRRQALLEYRFTLEYGAREKPVLMEASPLIRTGRDLEVLLPPVPKVQATMVELLLRSSRKDSKEKVAAGIKLAHGVVARACKVWPHERAVQIAHIEVLLALGKTAEARIGAEELIHKHQNPGTYSLLARAAGRDKGSKAAIAVLNRARRHYPLHKDTAFKLARAYLADRDFDNAVKVVKEIQEQSQSTAMLVKTHSLLAHIYKVSGSPHQSRHHIEQLRRLRGKR